MKEKSIASRYAKALFDIAEEKNSLDAFLEQWGMIAEIIRHHEEARTLFESRLLPKESKKELAKNLFSPTVDPFDNQFSLSSVRQRTRKLHRNDPGGISGAYR